MGYAPHDNHGVPVVPAPYNIGWFILCILTAGIGFLWLGPYVDTALAAFYEEVKADYALNGGLD